MHACSCDVCILLRGEVIYTIACSAVMHTLSAHDPSQQPSMLQREIVGHFVKEALNKRSCNCKCSWNLQGGTNKGGLSLPASLLMGPIQ